MDRLKAIAASALLLVGFAVVTAGAAVGQSSTPATPLTVTKTAYFTKKILGALPPVLVREVPPAPVCVVAPQLCGAEVDALKTALSLNDGLPLPDVPDFLIPQPVPPGELPVGMIGGQGRYTSLVQFQVPQLTPNATVNRFELVIQDGALAFSIQSPAFRQLVLTALSQYPNQQPEVIEKFVADVSSQTTPLADFTPTGIEACLATQDWAAGESQDPNATPTVDCIVGGAGTHDAAAGTWTFDITGIVQAWANGAPNHGVALSPVGAQNVAYGDPDPSTNWIVTLASEAAGALAARFDIGPPAVEDVIADTSDVVGESLDATGGAPFSDTGSFESTSGALTPPAETGSATPGRARLARSAAETPWWIWLAFPFVLAGCYAMSQALDATPNLATRRPGALSRLTADMETS